jgi:hypothetical protein
MIRYVKRVTKNPRKTIWYLEEINVLHQQGWSFLELQLYESLDPRAWISADYSIYQSRMSTFII